MDDSEQFRKIFIGGLHLNTDDDSLRKFYEQWGEVVDCVVMRDPYSRRSRGFGFVTYSHAHMVDEALAARPHVIDSKQVDPKRAMPREESNKPEAHLTCKKVFVGGVRDGCEESDLREYFGNFGQVHNIDVVSDRETGKKRGYAFIEFDDSDVVDKIVLIRTHMVGSNRLEVKKAMEREQKVALGRGVVHGGPRGAPYNRGRGAQSSYSVDYGDRMSGYGPGSYGGGYGYGGGYSSSAYSSGYGSSPGWGSQNGAWGQSSTGYGNGYGSTGNSGFGTGYSGSYGGGAMKGSGYNQRAAGPYGGSYGGYGIGSGYGGNY